VRRETRALTSMWPSEPPVAHLPPFDDVHDDSPNHHLGHDLDDDMAGPPGPDRRWLLAGIGSVLVLGVLAAIAGWFLGGGSGVVTGRRWSAIDEQAAQRMLTGAGLTSVVTEKHNDQVPVGTVALSDPVAGTEVGKGSRVTLTVSTGHTPGTDDPGGDPGRDQPRACSAMPT